MSDDARLICSPVVWDAAIPPARWPGGKPRFTVDAGFYLAAFRGELGHLVNVGRRHARLAGGGGQSLASREMASPTVGELWQTAHALRQYHGSFTGAIKGRAIAGDEVGAEFLLGSSRLVSHLAAEMLGRSAADFADVFAATGILEFCEAVLEVSLPIAFDFSKPPVPAVATPEPPVAVEAAGPTQEGLPDLVTLDQMAAMVHRGKRTLERRKTAGKLPAPRVEGGGGGKPDLWDWTVVRPWLTDEFGVPLPDRLPANRR